MVDFNLQPVLDCMLSQRRGFTLIEFLINFATPQTADNSAARNLLDTFGNQYGSISNADSICQGLESSIWRRCQSASVSRIGYAHTLRVRAEAVDDRFAQPGIFASLVDILYQMIFHPLITDGAFDAATFKTQRQNVANELASIKENKQYYAAWQLDRLYYDQSSLMRIPSYGRLEIWTS